MRPRPPIACFCLASLLLVGCATAVDDGGLPASDAHFHDTLGAVEDTIDQNNDDSGLDDDSGLLDDTSVDDSGSPADDSGVPPDDSGAPPDDSGAPPTDTGLVDSGSPPVDSGSTGTDTGSDAGSGCSVNDFGLTEIMIRAISGAGDAHEWLELTNFDGCTLDVSGVTVKISNTNSTPTTTLKAVYSFPSGTHVAAGAAVVLADNDTNFKADAAGYGIDAAIFGMGAVCGAAPPTACTDVFGNSAIVTVALYATASDATPYEKIDIPTRTWPVGQSYAYPAISSTCPASARITAGAPSSAWKLTAANSANQFGSVAGTTSTPEYGAPAKPNASIVCP